MRKFNSIYFVILFSFSVILAMTFAVLHNNTDSEPVKMKVKSFVPADDWFERQRAYPFAEIPNEEYIKSIEYAKRNIPADKNITANWSLAGPINIEGRITTIAIHPTNPQIVYAGCANGGVWKSTNFCASWVSVFDNQNTSSIGALAIDPSNPSIIYCGTGEANSLRSYYPGTGMYKSTDAGATWQQSGLPNTYSIGNIAINWTNTQELYAAAVGSLRRKNNERGIYKSTDGGFTFSTISSGMPNRTITSIYIHPDSSKVAIVTFSGFGAGKIYKTTNGGTNWNNMSGNLPDSPVNDGMIYYPGFTTSYYLAAMDIGVFMTSNWGVSWIELADGLPNTVAMDFDYNLSGNKIRIGTHGRSVYEISGYLTNIVNYNNEIPRNFELGQNYPNPFNPNTRIKFSIINKGFVNLEVYNILGKKVNQLVNNNLDAGSYEINFDGSNLPSGIYIYKLTTNNFSQAKNMTLIK